MARLASRVGRGYMAAIVALVLVVASTLVAFQVARHESAKVHGNHIPSIEAAAQLQTLLTRMDNLEFLYLSSGADREAWLRQFDETAGAFDRAYLTAEAMVSRPIEVDQYGDIGRHYGAFLHIHQRMRNLAASGQWEAARRLNATESLQAEIALREAASAFFRSNVEAAGRSRLVEDRTLLLTEVLAVSLALFGILMAGYFWRRVTRDIVVPLDHLRLAAGAIAAGRDAGEAHPVSTRTEEIADLQAEFFRMASELRRMTGALQAANVDLEAQVSGRTSELREANERLEANVEALRAVDKLKSEFVAVTSHELLTPLAFIVGFASSLEDGLMGPLAPPQQEAVGRILEGAERLTRMVRNTLEFSQVEAGQLAFHPARVDLGEAARQGVDEQAENARKAGVELAVTVAPDLAAAWADPDRVAQVIAELLDNAIKFTARGGQVRLAVSAGSDGLVCEVADTGPGIPPEAIARLHQPFYQVDSSPTRRHGGLGLGLALSHRLARGMGGDLTVRSRVGHGSTFQLVLPNAPNPGA
ncbi:MAG: ATP-binding protein [Candidatus Sericytochromatia bacterium]